MEKTKKRKSKRVAVLFSGGLDSTYLVWKNLKDGNKVLPIYIEIENNEVKTILEKNRTELLYREFAKEFNPTDTFEEKISNVHHAISVGVRANEDSLHFKQVPIWIFALTFMQSMNVDEIQIGYVGGDDAISYLDDIQNIYKSYQVICKKMVPLVFPITKLKKWMMVEELPSQYLELVISCENARIIGDRDAEVIQYEPCCECGACRTIVASNYYEVGTYPDNYKNGLIKYHSHQLKKFDYNVIDKDGVDYFEKMCKLEPRKEPYQLRIDFDCKIEHEMEMIKAEEND